MYRVYLHIFDKFLSNSREVDSYAGHKTFLLVDELCTI